MWDVRVDGAAVPLGDSLTFGQWTCASSVDPPERNAGAINQFGALTCEHPDGHAAETFAMCSSRPQKPEDSGRSSLILTQNEQQRSLEIGCRTQGVTVRPPLNLVDGATGTHLGLPRTRPPAVPGTFRWQLDAAAGPMLLGAPGPFPIPDPTWACSQQVSGVNDPTYGYAEYGTASCTHGDTTVTTMVPCVKQDGRACMPGNLRLASEAHPLTSLVLICEDIGNPGCF